METPNVITGRQKRVAVNAEKATRTRKKAASLAANEESVAAELKNREHGNEQPAR